MREKLVNAPIANPIAYLRHAGLQVDDGTRSEGFVCDQG
jgi:hypothetical protein